MNAELDPLIARGHQALADCRWDAARDCFERAREVAETAEVLDGLGQALYWLGEHPEALSLRERAFALYRERDQHRPAAMAAIQLAALHGLIFGNTSAVNGWVGHAQQMLDGAGDCPEQGWLELFLAVLTSDPAEREQRAQAALRIGRRFARPELEFDALAYVGKSLVERGAVDEGMARVDQAVAAISSGVVSDPWATGEILCTLFHVCEMTADITRAQDWLGAVDHYVERTGERPVSAICRMHYGGLLTAAGRWERAEHELLAAAAIYEDTYRGTRYEALIRLADLRARQGRTEEARRLVAGHEHRPDAAVACARIHLADGELELARDVLERHLGRRGRGWLAAPALALLVQIELARGDVESATAVADELGVLAGSGTDPILRGFASLSQARAARAGGDTDPVEPYQEALAAFTEADLLHEVAVTQFELGTLLAAERPEVAHSHARAALEGFQAVGADADTDAAAALLRRLGDRTGRSWPKNVGTLTERQTQVLGLLAEGLTNAEIAARLYISPRTAEHHVSNILSQLGLANRSEAVAYALRRALDGGAGGGPRRQPAR